MLKIILVGATGAMGHTVKELVNQSKDYKLVAGLAEKEDLSDDFPIYSSFSNIDQDADVIIDFSNRSLLDDLIGFAKEKNIPVVFATTGYNDQDLSKIKALADKLAIIQEGNYSLGINIMLEISKKLAKSLADFDIEIVESHHKYKKDNPSGTAQMLFDSVNEARGENLKKKMRNFSNDDKREDNEVGISSIRGGSVVGVHSLKFLGLDEVLEIKHEAGSKKIFAVGALKAADYISKKPAGLYNFSEVLNDD